MTPSRISRAATSGQAMSIVWMRPLIRRRSLILTPVAGGQDIGGLVHVTGPGEKTQEGQRAGQGGMRLMRRVPDRAKGGQFAKRRVGGKAPAMRAGQRQVKFRRGMPVIPVDRPGDALVDALTEFSEG